MNRQDAKKIAEIVTTEQLKEMLNNAKNGIKDWTKVSNVNKGLTKGVAWNIFSKCTIDARDRLATVNMIREFGDWLPIDLLHIPKPPREEQAPTHQEPNFDNLSF